RQRVDIVEGHRTGRAYRPAALFRRHGLAALPRHLRGALAAGVGQLDGGHRALFGDELRDGRERGRVRVAPDAEVGGADAAFGRHGRGFHHDHAGAAHRPAAQVDQVPVAGQAVAAGILAHRRDADAVLEGHAAQLQRGKQQAGHAQFTVTWALRTTSRHLAVSLARYAPKSAGVPPRGSSPMSAKRLPSAALRSARLIASFMVSTTAAGVLRGATMPYHGVTSYPGAPA